MTYKVIAMRITSESPLTVERICKHHGETEYRRITRSRPEGRAYGYRCVQCNAENKTRHRRRVRDTLIQEAGGKCARCDYSRCVAALQFHHLDPTTKSFELSKLSTSVERARDEAKKCILLCANCHAEEHAGLV